MGESSKVEGSNRKSADEILAAQKADPSLGQREIGKRFGHSQAWVRDILKWAAAEHSSTRSSPFAREPGIAGEDRAAFRKMLREAPLEEIERMLHELEPRRRRAIMGAGKLKRKKPNMRTPAEEKAIEAEVEAELKDPMMKAVGSMLSPAAYLESGLETARMLNETDGEIGDDEYEDRKS